MFTKWKSFERNVYERKVPEVLIFRQASKRKFWENEKNILVFACSYHPLHKRAFLQSIRWLQPLLTKRLPRGCSGDNWNAYNLGLCRNWSSRQVLGSAHGTDTGAQQNEFQIIEKEIWKAKKRIDFSIILHYMKEKVFSNTFTLHETLRVFNGFTAWHENRFVRFPSCTYWA